MPNFPNQAPYRKLRDQAYRLLARREHSAFELRRKLTSPARRQTFDTDDTQAPTPHPTTMLTDDIDRLLADLAEQGAQSDARFAESLCRQRYQSGKGPLKLRHELMRHQLPPALIDRLILGYADQWHSLAREVRRKKFGEQPPATYADWTKQAKFLQQRGFSTDQIEPFGQAV